jgi:D-alanyl-D-alanine carboxypeptidase
MRSANLHQTRRSTRDKLSATAAACALLAAAGLVSGGTASASAGTARGNGIRVQAALRHDISQYLTAEGKAEHISAVSLRVSVPGSEPSIDLATGTTRFGGGSPVSASALWQIGSNTKAFTAVILLQLEAEGRLSIGATIGKWLPQYPAWRNVTIRQLLDMTSRIPDYAIQPAFVSAIATAPAARFSAARLVSYVTGLPLDPAGYSYSDTNYILAQMIIERVTHDSYADQLTRRIIIPLGLRNMCYAPYTCPAADAARMPTGTSRYPPRHRCSASPCHRSP